MPVKPKKQGDKYIVVESESGKKSKNSGTFDTRKEAEDQAKAINANTKKKKK